MLPQIRANLVGLQRSVRVVSHWVRCAVRASVQPGVGLNQACTLCEPDVRIRTEADFRIGLHQTVPRRHNL